MGGSISAFWTIAGYVAAVIVTAIPFGALFLLTRKRRWRHRIRWAGEVPIIASFDPAERALQAT